ncbi:MAG: Fic family protein [bacterium]
MPFDHLRFRRHWDLSEETIYQLGQCQALIHALTTLPLGPAVMRELKQVSIRKGAQATTAIEGNTLTEDEVQKVLEGKRLPESKSYQAKEVSNVVQAMNRIMQDFSGQATPRLITPQLLKQFHSMIGEDLPAPFNATPGQFAQSQRVVGGYRCPPFGREKNQVEGLVDQLCKWLQSEFRFASGKQSFRNGIIQAIVTHVYIEWIHPFDDGNGRTGRLVEFYLLLRAGVPDICAHILSNHYNNTRPEYYGHIAKGQKERELTSFIAYAVTGFLDGLNEVWEIVAKVRLHKEWQAYVDDKIASLKWSKPVASRRKHLLMNMPLRKSYNLESIQLTSPQIAQAYATVSMQTLRNDIKDLIQEELLIKDSKTGEFSTNHSVLSNQYPNKIR